MRVLDKATFIEAHKLNFSSITRKLTDIDFIVVHYTGNKNDTARNNALYFRNTPVQSSAHFFVDEENIYQSVQLNHAAYAVGLGGRKEPYFKYPSMWKKITNSNSVSVEICGSKDSREGTETTKRTAAKLVADLLDALLLTPASVYRHYDVTGKNCPAWAVEDPLKWLSFTLMVNQYFYDKEDEEMLLDTPENYSVFKTFMDRYLSEKATENPEWAREAMTYCQSRGLINDGRPNSNVTRAELATVLMRMNA